MREDLLKEMYRKVAEAGLIATLLDLATVVNYLDMAGAEILEAVRKMRYLEKEPALEEE